MEPLRPRPVRISDGWFSDGRISDVWFRVVRFGVVRLAAWSLLVSLCASSSWAQVDLPQKQGGGEPAKTPEKRQDPAPRRGSGRGIVPHLVCAVCGEPNYTAARNKPTQGGFFEAWCMVCRQYRIHRPSSTKSRTEGLDLPQAPGAGAAGRAPESAASEEPAGASAPPQPVPQRPRLAGQLEAARFVYDQLGAVTDLGDAMLAKALESLLALGDDGLVASRVALHDESEARMLVASRVLLRGGRAEDGQRVADRLRGKVPNKLGPRILKELIEADPVHGSPQLLVELMEHRQQRMRQAAMRHLKTMLSPDLLSLLETPLSSTRSETRLNAVALLAQIEDPAVIEILLAHLADPSARVASEVVEAVAGLDAPQVALRLQALAFSGRWILRDNAYALLAIIDREDITLEPILDERNAEVLLRGLEVRDSFVFGTCAAALAGIGFRAERPADTQWLDREVTGRLVSVVSGKEFHNDYSALLPRALRRLRLITGQDFGSDGPSWARWWVAERETFYARRVRISLDGERLGRLELHYRSTGAAGEVFSLVGPAVPEREARDRAGTGELFRITERECRDLSALLEREGALSAERIPGLRGDSGRGTRRIEILVEGRGKAFSFGPGSDEPWFDRIAAALRDLRDRNRWQRFPDLAEYESLREFWEVESGWWGGDHDELERALRLKGLVLKALPKLAPSQRNLAIEELERIYETPGARSVADFRNFLELLRDEGFYVERARRVVALALLAASIDASEDEEGPRVPAELGSDLLELLAARFGPDAADDLVRVASACGREFVRDLADEESPLLRTVAAAAIGYGLEGERVDGVERAADVELLTRMLEDPEPFVEAAACLALGRAGVEGARTDLLVRARVGDTAVRAAALRAVGALGGDYVLEALVLGASAAEPEVRRAAAEGLVELRDPKAAPLLVSMLGRGRDSEVFDAAWRGLLDLGSEAWPELERVMNSPVHRARREAALLLARQGVPRSAGALIGILANDPADSQVGEELAILTCIDFREADDPGFQWERWWDQVVHDDSLAWLLAAMERRSDETPSEAALRGAGRADGALFLLTVMKSPESYLVERGRRELSRLLGREVEPPPPAGLRRDLWLEELRVEISERYDTWAGSTEYAPDSDR